MPCVSYQIHSSFTCLPCHLNINLYISVPNIFNHMRNKNVVNMGTKLWSLKHTSNCIFPTTSHFRYPHSLDSICQVSAYQALPNRQHVKTSRPGEEINTLEIIYFQFTKWSTLFILNTTLNTLPAANNLHKWRNRSGNKYELCHIS